MLISSACGVFFGTKLTLGGYFIEVKSFFTTLYHTQVSVMINPTCFILLNGLIISEDFVVEQELTSKFRIMKRVGCSLKPSENKKKYSFK